MGVPGGASTVQVAGPRSPGAGRWHWRPCLRVEARQHGAGAVVHQVHHAQVPLGVAHLEALQVPVAARHLEAAPLDDDGAVALALRAVAERVKAKL